MLQVCRGKESLPPHPRLPPHPSFLPRHFWLNYSLVQGEDTARERRTKGDRLWQYVYKCERTRTCLLCCCDGLKDVWLEP